MNNKKKKQIEDFKKIGIKNPDISFTDQVNKTASVNLQFIAQFDNAILNQISWLFHLIFKTYIFWINSFIYKKVLNKQITSKTKKWYSALSEARNYGAIILKKEDRNWINQIASEYKLTDSQKFLLVWSRCINYKKRIFNTNAQNDLLTKFFMFYLSVSNWIFLLLQSFIILFDISFLSIKFLFAILFIYLYFQIVKIFTLVLKSNVWDSNKLTSQLLVKYA